MTKPCVPGMLPSFADGVFRTLFFPWMTALFFLCCAPAAPAQTNPLPLGTITSQGPVNCTVNGSNPLPQASCIAYVVDCSNVDSALLPLTATLAVSNPVLPALGTILIHSGSGGTTYFTDPSPTSYAAKYLQAGFQVVQMAWATAWQSNYKPGTTLKPLKFAACRTATVLNYVDSAIHTSGAMCAQAHSAGSAAIAYSLAWYGASAYLDNALLTSGPVFGDLRLGCQYPNVVKNVTVCAGGIGCDGPQWTDFPQFQNGSMGTGDAAKSVAGYTIPGSNCNNWNPSLGNTTPSQNQAWKNMSIVSPNASYTYPKTSLRAFLCAPPSDGDDTQNNSAGQAWPFYANFFPAGSGTALNFLVHRVDDCTGDEQIWYGTDNGQSAFTVSMNDMTTYCVKNH